MINELNTIEIVEEVDLSDKIFVDSNRNIIPNNIINSHSWTKLYKHNFSGRIDYKCVNCSHVIVSCSAHFKLKNAYLYTAIDVDVGVDKLLTCQEIQLENIIK